MLAEAVCFVVLHGAVYQSTEHPPIYVEAHHIAAVQPGAKPGLTQVLVSSGEGSVWVTDSPADVAALASRCGD